MLDNLRSPTGEGGVAGAEPTVLVVDLNTSITQRAAFAGQGQASFLGIEAVITGLSITVMRPPRSSSTKTMMRLPTPIMLAAMPTHRERLASSVSTRSSITCSSPGPAASDGVRKNDREVIIGRCMLESRFFVPMGVLAEGVTFGVVHCGDIGHVLIIEFKSGQVEVLTLALRVQGLRDGHVAVLEVPAQNGLNHGNTVLGGDTLQVRVAQHLE